MLDPIERMEMQQERLIDQWMENQIGVPEGSFRCPYCKNVFNYEPISISDSPVSPVMCYDCLPEADKKAFDSFFNS